MVDKFLAGFLLFFVGVGLVVTGGVLTRCLSGSRVAYVPNCSLTASPTGTALLALGTIAIIAAMGTVCLGRKATRLNLVKSRRIRD